MITHEIIGDDMQAVVITLAAGEEVRAEAGAMTYMTDGIEMDARMTGGILGGLTRKFLAGESLFLTYFKCAAATGRAAATSAIGATITKSRRVIGVGIGRILAARGAVGC